MALFEVFHVVASEIMIDPTDADQVGDIPQGSLVTLDANGYVTMLNAVDSNPPYCIGIAGDSRSQGTTSYTAESGQPLATLADPLKGALVIGSAVGATPARRYTQNRVSDYYNEVLASGKMTVYHSGGEFWSDIYDSTVTYVPASPVYMSDTLPGHFTSTVIANHIVGICLNEPTAYPSGVPGTETGFTQLPEGGNSLSFGNFLKVKLLV